MIIKDICEGPEGDYCIASNTIKCLFIMANISLLCEIKLMLFLCDFDISKQVY